MAETPTQLDQVAGLIDGPACDLASSSAWCRRITARAGSSFSVGIRLTPARCRDAMHAIYAWMRLADDAADAQAPAEARAAMLDRFESRTREALAGRAHATIWPAFAHAVAQHGLDAAWFDASIQGVRTDLRAVHFETEAQLDLYCDRVAGNVGRCCVGIWGLREGVQANHAYQFAAQRGRAFQRINIARDLLEDARAGRRYVPDERLVRLGVGLSDAAVRIDLLREANDLLEASGPLDAMVRRDAGPALWAMTRAYRLVARRLGRSGPPAVLGGGVKLGIAAGALGRRALVAGRLA